MSEVLRALAPVAICDIDNGWLVFHGYRASFGALFAASSGRLQPENTSLRPGNDHIQRHRDADSSARRFLWLNLCVSGPFHWIF